jgi:hypothetical protein
MVSKPNQISLSRACACVSTDLVRVVTLDIDVIVACRYAYLKLALHRLLGSLVIIRPGCKILVIKSILPCVSFRLIPALRVAVIEVPSINEYNVAKFPGWEPDQKAPWFHNAARTAFTVNGRFP